MQRLYPQAGATSIEVAGGVARFAGIDALSQAFGVGTLAPVGADEIALLTEFYESRHAKACVYVTPMTDSSLAGGLAAAGYAPAEYENVLVSDNFDAYARYDPRVALAADLRAWALASTRGFGGNPASEAGDTRVAMVLASAVGTFALEGREGDAIAATAALSVRGECAFFFAGATMPELRRSGWHTALIRDRIARARDAGVRIMRATAPPGSTSERNFRRCGFVTLYTRSLWERDIGRQS